MSSQQPRPRAADRPSLDTIELPSSLRPPQAQWGSDHIAELLRGLGFDYIALNPGSSFRGLHDSLVNHLGNRGPQILLCLHEEHAVAIAHGWSKVTGRPMAVALHSNVGLMHASMAIYNAWCDRVPMLVLGGAGPLDAAQRRPWIDWIHSARDQGALIRPFVKWDDHPGSIEAAQEALLRGLMLAETTPKAPVYISLDVSLQESRADAPAPDLRRYAPPRAAVPDSTVLDQVVERIAKAARPLLLIGRVSRSVEDWNARVELAERLGARVLSDLKMPAGFPNTHSLHAAPAGIFPTPSALAVARAADLIISLDWVDLGGLVRAAWGHESPAATIVHVSVDQQIHNGWSMDHLSLPPADVRVLCEPDVFVTHLLSAMRPTSALSSWHDWNPPAETPAPPSANGTLGTTELASALRKHLSGRDVCLIRTPLSWAGDSWPIDHPLDALGYDGGGGIGSGPGMTVGAALALRGTERLPLAVLGDGDFMMGASAIWTAVHYRIPALIVVANNASFFNDEMHQERVALARDRPVENRWIGQRIADPGIDIAGIARAQGAMGIGPVIGAAALHAALKQAIEAVDAGQTVIVDVHVSRGYQEDFNAVAFD